MKIKALKIEKIMEKVKMIKNRKKRSKNPMKNNGGDDGEL